MRLWNMASTANAVSKQRGDEDKTVKTKIQQSA